jgi:hypothetical protein
MRSVEPSIAAWSKYGATLQRYASEPAVFPIAFETG